MFNPSAGNRNRINGLLNNQGTNGNYWSSTVNGTNARNLNFNSTAANTNNNNRANGFSVRCLKDYVWCFLCLKNVNCKQQFCCVIAFLKKQYCTKKIFKKIEKDEKYSIYYPIANSICNRSRYF
jgi:hypothetical protein